MEYQNFTSLPPDQERQFIVYEQTSVEARKKAMTLGIIAGACVGVLAVMLFMAYDAPKNAHAVDEPSELKEEAPKAKAAPAPAPAPEPAAEAPAEEAPAAAATEAPPPPAGATKAPPTALIGQ